MKTLTALRQLLAFRTTIIYGLCDPRIGMIRYVGKTVMNIEDRLKRHIQEAKRKKDKNHRTAWLLKLSRENIIPTIIVLGAVAKGELWEEVEEFWIAYLRSHNYDLINATTGGEGSPGNTPDAKTRAKMRASQLGRRHSAETRAKISASNTGKKHTPETIALLKLIQSKIKRVPPKLTLAVRKKISKTLTGRKMSSEARYNMSVAQTGRHHSAETKFKIGRANKGKRRTKTHRINMVLGRARAREIKSIGVS